MPEIFHPSGIPVYIRSLIFAIIISGLAFIVSSFLGELTNIIIIVAWVIAFLRSTTTWIANRFKRIEVGNEDIVVKTGLVNIKTIMVPYVRITNLNTHQTLFQRIFRLGTLIVDTAAGTHQPEIELPNLPYKAIKAVLEKTEGKASGTVR